MAKSTKRIAFLALISRALFGYLTEVFPLFFSVVRQMSKYTMQSRGTARTSLP
jgi:hypothetical protein